MEKGKSFSPGKVIVDDMKNRPSLSSRAVHDQKARLEKALTAQVLSSLKNILAGLVDFSKKRRKSSQYDSVQLTAMRSNDLLLLRRRFVS
jgi:predicted KAP-like P-loop ATPase